MATILEHPDAQALLEAAALTPGQVIADEIDRVLRRNGEARIYHGYARSGTYPPPRQGAD